MIRFVRSFVRSFVHSFELIGTVPRPAPPRRALMTMIRKCRHSIRYSNWLPLCLMLACAFRFCLDDCRLVANAFVTVRVGVDVRGPSFSENSIIRMETRTTHTSTGACAYTGNTRLHGIKGFRSWFESQFPEAIFAMPTQTAHEEFDHVLIDVNQLLHVALRRSRSEGHALTLFMKELDSCLICATPKRSVVLAMDGPPSAAKLATQRRRRYSTVVRTEWKQQQLTVMLERGSTMSKQQEARKRRRYATDTNTLAITPGTAFMNRAHQAILYWAWQRLANPGNPLSNCRIYLSPSTVPGEGEVKLLDWILQQKIKPGSSIAILGGDSDLVLEGLVIPPSITHNVHVLLPDGNKKFLAVSLWETTRALARFLPKLKGQDMMRVRTDLVLLLIMNGNDYLPKLRGSSGFNKLFHNYLRLVHQWLDDPSHGEPFLVDPDSLEFNLPFTVAFFQHLAYLAPTNLYNSTAYEQSPQSSEGTRRLTPLSQLNNLVDSGFIPSPIKWSVLSHDSSSQGNGDSDIGSEDTSTKPANDAQIKVGQKRVLEPLLDQKSNSVLDNARDGISDELLDRENEGGVDEDAERGDQSRLLQLELGRKGTKRYYSYQVWHETGVLLKKNKQQLASLALEEILGIDISDMESTDMSDDELEDDFMSGITNSGYSWEVQHSVPGKVNTYLGGLLWNLQTYQDGICADYAYNYGRRMSPTAKEIGEYLKDAMIKNRTVGIDDLIGNTFNAPVSAGLSCLAALPTQVNDLVPEPYRWLTVNNTVEELYATCMDAEDNVFDMKGFESLCEDQIKKMKNETDRASVNEYEKNEGKKGRRIILGDHYWTVISRLPRGHPPMEHPFEPPAPFSDRLSDLRPSRRLKVSRAMATVEPLRRSKQRGNKSKKRKVIRHQKGTFRKDVLPEIGHSDLGDLLITPNGKQLRIENVFYGKAYQKLKDTSKKKSEKVVFDLKFPREDDKADEVGSRKPKKHRHRTGFNNAARMKEHNIVPPPKEYATNLDGFTALQCLQQLKDADMIGSMEFEYMKPSKSQYASFNPNDHENIQLVVRQGNVLRKSVLNKVLTYEQDRDITSSSKQAVKQYLASLALCSVIGPKMQWSEVTFKELRGYLRLRQKP